MAANTMLASPALSSAMIRFCAVTSTEHAQQSREPLNFRGVLATSLLPLSYGGGTTTPDVRLEGDRGSEGACSDPAFSSVPLRDRLIFVVSCVVNMKMLAADDGSLKDLMSAEWSETKRMPRMSS